MSESIGGAGVVGKIHTPQRVAELEIDVARLVAELDEARGGDSTTGASRFLTIAVSTIDQAVSEVTQEAEKAVAELRNDLEQSQLEARQEVAAARLETEAARAAAAQVTVGARQELEDARRSAMTLAEEAATGALETKRDAQAEAEQMVALARNEATMAMVSERRRFTREVGALSDVREALIKERHALEQYHLQLQARVRELAQAMVSFMTNTSENDSLDDLAKLATPEIEAPPAAQTVPQVPSEPDPTDRTDPESVQPRPEGHAESPEPRPEGHAESPEPRLEGPFAESPDSQPEDLFSGSDDSRPEDLFSLAPDIDPTDDSAPDGLGRPATSPSASPRPVVEAVPPRHEPEPASAAPPAQEDPWRQVDPNDDPPPPLFGVPVAPISAGDSAQGDDEAPTGSEADTRFQDFIDGDEDDASRSWLLRSDKS